MAFGVNKKSYEKLKKLNIDVMTLRKSYMGKNGNLQVYRR